MKSNQAYFNWLIDTYIASSCRSHDAGYRCLLGQMHRKLYYFIITNDENRAADGLYLRDIYLDDPEHCSDRALDGPCTFLEFIIGIAVRLENLLMDEREIPVSAYFWKLLDHITLTEYTDDLYSSDYTTFIVDEIMTDVMDRKYSRLGEGGLFPLRHSRKNQVNVEIWYQLSAYLDENEDFFDQ